MIWLWALVLGSLVAAPALASDTIETQGQLSDVAFYRLVACGAAPGKTCQRPFVRWTAPAVRVGIVQTDPGFPDPAAAQAALTNAIAQVNTADLSVKLTASTTDPQIKIVLSDLPADSIIRDTGIEGFDGRRTRHVYVHIWWNADHEITRAAILLSSTLAPDAYRSVMLEELVQALGPITDIRNPAYAGRSLFAADDNITTTLAGQDLVALRRLYAE